MESITHKKQQEELHQAEIRRQIAALQAQLVDVSNTTPQPPKKRTQEAVLAPASPSPKRRKLDKQPPSQPPRYPTSRPKVSTAAKHPQQHISKPAPSTLVSKLASITSRPDSRSTPVVNRSSGFSERPPISATLPEKDEVHAAPRDDRLTLVENLEIGPTEHKAPFDDPHFLKLEPNSGIRLSSRTLAHEELQDYLRGRYYLSPSKLYSVVRLQPNKQGYDIPVEGDWVTIAVVAERGPLRYTKAPVGVGKDGADETAEKEDTLDDLPLDGSSGTIKIDLKKWKGKPKQQQGPPKPSGKRYVNLKLVDFGCQSSSSSTSGKVIRGDASLSLLLFESDRVEVIKDEDGKKREIYHGGSRGAFERMTKLREGTVVAFLNPKILKPFQRSSDAPHPVDNILALTPESADATVVIGHSEDLRMCKAVKRDGKVCGSWCDKRISEVCEFHMLNAVKRNRASRPEFSMGTSGLTTGPKRSKPAFDPARQWGLLPDNAGGSGSATYVVSGHVVSGSADPRSLYVGETVGRAAQARAARATAKDADRALQKLLQRDKDGMKYVLTARDYEKKRSQKEREEDSKKEKAVPETKKRASSSKSKGKAKQVDLTDSDSSSGSSSEDDENRAPKEQAKSYSAQLIRNLGFDPTGREGKKIKDTDVQKKLDALAALHASKRAINLGPRPGKKMSTVHPPSNSSSNVENAEPLDSDSDDLVIEPPIPDVKMVSLDSSDLE